MYLLEESLIEKRNTRVCRLVFDVCSVLNFDIKQWHSHIQPRIYNQKISSTVDRASCEWVHAYQYWTIIISFMLHKSIVVKKSLQVIIVEISHHSFHPPKLWCKLGWECFQPFLFWKNSSLMKDCNRRFHWKTFHFTKHLEHACKKPLKNSLLWKSSLNSDGFSERKCNSTWFFMKKIKSGKVFC